MEDGRVAAQKDLQTPAGESGLNPDARQWSRRVKADAGGMHPCASEEGKCCGSHKYAASIIRFTSHFHAEGARVMLAYDVYPYCGDGLDLVVSQNFVDSYRERAVLLQHGCVTLSPAPMLVLEWMWHLLHAQHVDAGSA